MNKEILDLLEAAEAAKGDPEALQEIANVLTPIFENVIAAAMEVVKEITDALMPIIRAVMKAISEFYDAVLVATAKAVNTRWLHYWKHSKKKRIREKYRKRIARELINSIRQAALQAFCSGELINE